MSTNIAWVKNVDGSQGETWNCVVGCTHAGSPGCDHCYARELHNRRHEAWKAACAYNSRYGLRPGDAEYRAFADTCPRQYHKPFSEVQCLPERLSIPLKRKKPTTYFVDSMSDLFHEDVPVDFVGDVLAVMPNAPQHTFIVATKRPERALAMMTRYAEVMAQPRNLWLLASASTQAEIDRVTPILLEIPAAVRGLSLEPLLEGIDIFPYLYHDSEICGCDYDVASCPKRLQKLDWIIAGCESGPHRRPAELQWFRDLRDQCQDAGVPYFLKQVAFDGQISHHPMLDGQEWRQLPHAVARALDGESEARDDNA